MLSCMVPPRFGQEDKISMPAKFDLQFPSLASGLPKNDENSSPQNEYFIKCPQCQQEMPGFQALKDHIEEHHAIIKEEISLADHHQNHTSELLSKLSAMSPSTSNGYFNHKLSPPPSSTSSALLSPSNMSIGPGTDEGGRQSASPNNLNMIGAPAIHACSHCSLSFPTRDLLEKHEVMHAQNSTVSCKICHKQFANVYRLQRHMISHDESALLRKFKCTDCDKAFKFKHHLKEHIRIHSGEKPFACNNCGKRFSHSGSYSSHMTSKKCVSMGLKMNGLNAGLANALNPNFKAKQEKNQFLNVAKRQQQQQQQLAANLLTQSPLTFNNKFLPNSINGLNSFFPMAPKYGNYEEYAALFAQFQNPFYMMNHPFPYNFQNFLKLTAGAQQQDTQMSDLPKPETEHDEDNQEKSPMHQSELDNSHEDISEEHNESEPRLVMDLHDDEKNSIEDEKEKSFEKDHDEPRTSTPVPHENQQEDSLSLLRPKLENDIDHEMSLNDDQMNMRSRSPSPIKRNDMSPMHDQDESNMSDELRCRNCNKTFNHQTELVQHEKMLCNSLYQKHEGLLAQMSESFNSNYLANAIGNGINNMSEDENDDRESKVSTESERKVRVRTAISEEQQTALKEFYAMNSRPNREEFRQIAGRLNLDARVVQVWFQNNRSRERKLNGIFKQTLTQPSYLPNNLYSPPTVPTTTTNEDQPLDLSVKKEKLQATPSTSPRYGTVPLQQSPDEAINLSRKSTASPPYRPYYNYNNNTNDFLTRQIPSPNEAVPRPQNQNLRNGYGLPYALPFDRLLQFTPEMARNPLLMMRNDHRGNSLSPGSSEKRSWKDDESRHPYDEEFKMLIQQQQQQLQQHPPTKRATIAKIKAELPPDSDGMFTCDQCDKAFSKQSSLARHKYEHSGQRPYKCQECPKAFKHKHHLTEHKRLHSGEKPFQCSKCLKRFSHSGSYSQHMNHRYSYCKPYRE